MCVHGSDSSFSNPWSPKITKIPIKENYLMSGKLEETNEAYAIAKIAVNFIIRLAVTKSFGAVVRVLTVHDVRSA